VPLFVFAEEVAAIFNPEPGLVYWAETYVKLMAVAFVLTPVNIVISQAMAARNRLSIPVITDSIVLLGLMTPALIIATLAGAGVKALVLINSGSVILLTIVYVAIRRATPKRQVVETPEQ